MSKWLVLLAFPLLLFFTPTLEATPYYPNGIPSIGPLKGSHTFWGGKNSDEYFDGTSYEIKLPNKETLHLDISARVIQYQYQGTKSTHSFSIPNNIEGFSGKLNILLLNPKEKPIKKLMTVDSTSLKPANILPTTRHLTSKKQSQMQGSLLSLS
jgi:hypothetical protein